MHKNFIKILLIFSLVVPSLSSALTVPGPDADVEKLSYLIYLYYDNGQLFADRDYEIKYDVIQEAFSPESPDAAVAYKGEIINFKSEVAKTFSFDPKKGDMGFSRGKITVKGPYVADAMRVQFYDNQNKQVLSIFVNAASICNDDGACNSATGESTKTCPNDCKKPKATPVGQVPEQTSAWLGDFDVMTIATYASVGVGVLILAWFGWRWWKKRKEENFLPPPSAGGQSSNLMPPSPPGL